MLKKAKIRKGGHTYFLLGKDKEGIRYYLQKSEWACDWYWSFGCIDYAHGWTHFDSLFGKDPDNGSSVNLHDGFKKVLVESPLYNKKDPDEKKLWQLCDLMATAYTLKEAAEVLGRGGSHYTSNVPCRDIVQDETYTKHLNEDVLPKLFMQIENMLDPDYVEEEK